MPILNKPMHSLRRSRLVQLFFSSITFALIVFMLGLLEGLLRLFGPEFADDPYLNMTPLASFLSKREIGGVNYYKVTHPEYYKARNTIFPVKKDADVARIFYLGGSAGAGWPHPPRETASEYLLEALQAAFGGRKIEVHNVCMHAYASFRVRMIFDEIIQCDPDVIIIQSGNNEFLEKRTYLDDLKTRTLQISFLNRLRFIQLGRSYLYQWMFPEDILSGEQARRGTYTGWAIIERVSLDLRRDREQFESVKRHYAYNMEYMMREANRRGIPVIQLAIPVNLKDWKPNVSVNRLSEDELKRWRQLFQCGQLHLLKRDYEKAASDFGKAIEMEPQHAEAHFFLAQAFEKQGQYRLALEAYILAKDLDHTPLRSISAFNQTLRRTSSEYDQVYLVDMEEIFIRNAEDGLPGFDLFLDHVHATKKGNLLIAEEIFNTVLRENVLNEKSAVTTFARSDKPFHPDGTLYDEDRDFQVQTTLLWVYGMLHQYESVLRKVRHARQLFEEGERLAKNDDRELPTHGMEFVETVESIFPPYVEMRRKELLGDPVDPVKREEIMKNYHAFYEEFY